MEFLENEGDVCTFPINQVHNLDFIDFKRILLTQPVFEAHEVAILVPKHKTEKNVFSFLAGLPLNVRLFFEKNR